MSAGKKKVADAASANTGLRGDCGARLRGGHSNAAGIDTPLHEGMGIRVNSCPQMHWLGGWAVSESTMAEIAHRHLPQFEHYIYAPTQDGLEALRTAVCAPDSRVSLLGGYSTGAFLLLREMPAWGVRPPLRLFAPFVDFREESGLGGRVAVARVKLLLRRLRTAPLTAVADFYTQSVLSLPAPQELPYAADALTWGIEQLAQTQVELDALEAFLDANAPLALRAWVGADDALLDATRIAELLPHCKVLGGAGHDFDALLAACVVSGGIGE